MQRTSDSDLVSLGASFLQQQRHELGVLGCLLDDVARRDGWHLVKDLTDGLGASRSSNQRVRATARGSRTNLGAQDTHGQIGHSVRALNHGVQRTPVVHRVFYAQHRVDERAQVLHLRQRHQAVGTHDVDQAWLVWCDRLEQRLVKRLGVELGAAACLGVGVVVQRGLQAVDRVSATSRSHLGHVANGLDGKLAVQSVVDGRCWAFKLEHLVERSLATNGFVHRAVLLDDRAQCVLSFDGIVQVVGDAHLVQHRLVLSHKLCQRLCVQTASGWVNSLVGSQAQHALLRILNRHDIFVCQLCHGL